MINTTINDFRMILAILAAIVLVVVALIGWCVWRFCRKKRPKGNEKDKKGTEFIVPSASRNGRCLKLFHLRKNFIPRGLCIRE